MNMQIKEGPFKALGEWISNDENEITDLYGTTMYHANHSKEPIAER